MLEALLYILATVSANYVADWFVPLPGGALVAVGTLTFGATFTLRDRLHQRGRRWVYSVIAVAAIVNVVVAALLGIPWRIIGASFLAIVIAETTDTEIYQQLRARAWWLRVAGSNAVSVPLDTVLFTLLAFGGVFAPATLIAIIVGDIVVKYIVAGAVALWRPSISSIAPTAIGDLPR